MDKEKPIDLKKMFFYRIDTRTLNTLSGSNISTLNCTSMMVPLEKPFDVWAKEQKMIRVGTNIYQDPVKLDTQHTVNEITMEEYVVALGEIEEDKRQRNQD